MTSFLFPPAKARLSWIFALTLLHSFTSTPALADVLKAKQFAATYLEPLLQGRDGLYSLNFVAQPDGSEIILKSGTPGRTMAEYRIRLSAGMSLLPNQPAPLELKWSRIGATPFVAVRGEVMLPERPLVDPTAQLRALLRSDFLLHPMMKPPNQAQPSLAPIQKTALAELRQISKAAAAENRAAETMLIMPPGLGKTIVTGKFLAAEAATDRTPVKVFFIVQSKDILDEATPKLAGLLGLKPGQVRRAYGTDSRESLFETHTLTSTTRTTFYRQLAEFEEFRRNFQGRVYVVIDEAHHAGKIDGEFGDILREIKNAQKKGDLLLGLSATPWHTDSDLIERVFNNQVVTTLITPEEKAQFLKERRLIYMARLMLFRAMSQGYLSPLRAYRQIRYLEDEKGDRIISRDFLNDWSMKYDHLSETEKLAQLKKEIFIHVPLIREMIKEIAHVAKRDADGKLLTPNRGVIFVPSIAHANIYAFLLNKLSSKKTKTPILAKAYHSEMNQDERDKTMDWFRDQDVKAQASNRVARLDETNEVAHKYLFAIRALGEGVDEPRINHIVLAKGYSDNDPVGMLELIQNLGRGSRLSYPKTDFSVSDFTGDMKRLIFEDMDQKLVSGFFVDGAEMDFAAYEDPEMKAKRLLKLAPEKEIHIDGETLKEENFARTDVIVPENHFDPGSSKLPVVEEIVPQINPSPQTGGLINRPRLRPSWQEVNAARFRLFEQHPELMQRMSWEDYLLTPVALVQLLTELGLENSNAGLSLIQKKVTAYDLLIPGSRELSLSIQLPAQTMNLIRRALVEKGIFVMGADADTHTRYSDKVHIDTKIYEAFRRVSPFLRAHVAQAEEDASGDLRLLPRASLVEALLALKNPQAPATSSIGTLTWGEYLQTRESLEQLILELNKVPGIQGRLAEADREFKNAMEFLYASPDSLTKISDVGDVTRDRIAEALVEKGWWIPQRRAKAHHRIDDSALAPAMRLLWDQPSPFTSKHEGRELSKYLRVENAAPELALMKKQAEQASLYRPVTWSEFLTGPAGLDLYQAFQKPREPKWGDFSKNILEYAGRVAGDDPFSALAQNPKLLESFGDEESPLRRVDIQQVVFAKAYKDWEMSNSPLDLRQISRVTPAGLTPESVKEIFAAEDYQAHGARMLALVEDARLSMIRWTDLVKQLQNKIDAAEIEQHPVTWRQIFEAKGSLPMMFHQGLDLPRRVSDGLAELAKKGEPIEGEANGFLWRYDPAALTAADFMRLHPSAIDQIPGVGATSFGQVIESFEKIGVLVNGAPNSEYFERALDSLSPFTRLDLRNASSGYSWHIERPRIMKAFDVWKTTGVIAKLKAELAGAGADDHFYTWGEVVKKPYLARILRDRAALRESFDSNLPKLQDSDILSPLTRARALAGNFEILFREKSEQNLWRRMAMQPTDLLDEWYSTAYAKDPLTRDFITQELDGERLQELFERMGMKENRIQAFLAELRVSDDTLQNGILSAASGSGARRAKGTEEDREVASKLKSPEISDKLSWREILEDPQSWDAYNDRQVSVRTSNVLRLAAQNNAWGFGPLSLNTLAHLSPVQILQLPGSGRKVLNDLTAALSEMGLVADGRPTEGYLSLLEDESPYRRGENVWKKIWGENAIGLPLNERGGRTDKPDPAELLTWGEVLRSRESYDELQTLFPVRFDNHLRAAIANKRWRGSRSAWSLATTTKAGLRSIPGVGPGTVDEVTKILESLGLHQADGRSQWVNEMENRISPITKDRLKKGELRLFDGPEPLYNPWMLPANRKHLWDLAVKAELLTMVYIRSPAGPEPVLRVDAELRKRLESADPTAVARSEAMTELSNFVHGRLDIALAILDKGPPPDEMDCESLLMTESHIEDEGPL